MRKKLFEKLMQIGSFRLLLNFLLAIIILSNDAVAQLIGISNLPVIITNMWPSSGFSLAAILLYGFNVWPGLLIGHMSYYIIHLYTYYPSIPATIPTAFILSIGYVVQALLGGLIMRRFATRTYFNTIKDMLIFLLPVGLLTCLISVFVEISVLNYYVALSWNRMIHYGLTNLIGESMGIYTITPLLVIWSLKKPLANPFTWSIESISLASALLTIAFLSFIWTVPIAHLFMPLCLWITYRFGLHGATVAIFIFCVTAICSTSLERGSISVLLITNQMPILVSYLETIIASSLILAAVINERTLAIHILQDQNADLKEAYEVHVTELMKLRAQISINERLKAIGAFMSHIAKQIEIPLNGIVSYAKGSIEKLEILKDIFFQKIALFDQTSAKNTQETFEIMDGYLSNINKFEGYASKIALIIQEQTARATSELGELNKIDINTLLDQCLKLTLDEEKKRNPQFNIEIHKEFETSFEILLPLPEDLSPVFIQLLRSSLNSTKAKSEELGTSYSPTLQLRTSHQDEWIEISFYDNGIGVEKQRLHAFQPYLITVDSQEEMTAAGLYLAKDLIEHIYHGKIVIESEFGEYLKVTILLPRN